MNTYFEDPEEGERSDVRQLPNLAVDYVVRLTADYYTRHPDKLLGDGEAKHTVEKATQVASLMSRHMIAERGVWAAGKMPRADFDLMCPPPDEDVMELPGFRPVSRKVLVDCWEAAESNFTTMVGDPVWPGYVLPAMRILSTTMASSCGSERLFSLCKRVLTPYRRGVMGLDTFEALTFLSVLLKGEANYKRRKVANLMVEDLLMPEVITELLEA